MKRDGREFSYLTGDSERPAAVDHVIFGEQLEPVHPELTLAPALEDLRIMDGSQPDSDAEIGRVSGARDIDWQ